MNTRFGFVAASILALSGSFGALAQQPGDWVLAQWKGDKYWFPGVVESRAGDSVTILFDDGTRETRPSNQVRAYDWRAGTRVSCRWKNGTQWYPGRIEAVAADGVNLTITYDDGEREQTRTGACRAG